MTTTAEPQTTAQPAPGFGGVDTRADTDTAAATDTAGRLLAHRQFAATPCRSRQLTGWLGRHGQVQCVGVEGTDVHGAGLAHHRTAAGIELVEVARPDRRPAGPPASRTPSMTQARTGPVEAERALRVARRSAVAAIDRVTHCRMRWHPRTHAPAHRRRPVHERRHPLPRALLARGLHHLLTSPTTA